MKQGGKIKQADISRALKAANSAGLKVSRMEISPDGKLSIFIADRSTREPSTTPFDAWKERKNARPA